MLSAGINANKFDLDKDGIDRHFGVNWLGHYYACRILYGLIRKTSKMADTPAPRIVFESSEMHRGAPSNVHFASLQEINDSSLSPIQLYGRTKLAMILGVKYGLLDRVIKPNNDNVYALAVHPGAVSDRNTSKYAVKLPNTMIFLRLILRCNSSGKTPILGF